jgi:hypothetical protein
VVEDITFARRNDKTVIMGDWPDEVEFSRELLDTGAPFIEEEDGYIGISVYNGCASYEITGKRAGNGFVEPVFEVVTARLVNSFIGFDP